MRIIHVVIISMFVLFAIFAIHGYVTFDLNLNELKNSIEIKNKAESSSVMQNLDKYIKNRMDDFTSISQTTEVQKIIKTSNENPQETPLSQSNNNSQETPFLENSDISNLSNDFANMVDFYKQEYQYDISKQLYITNQYGLLLTLKGDTSNVTYSNQQWWKYAKNNGIFFGKIQLDKNSNTYNVPIALKITDDRGNFIGVIQVLLGLDTILHDFDGDSLILKDAGKNLVLVNSIGRIIDSNDAKYDPQSNSIQFYDKVNGDNGIFEITNENQDPLLVAYSRSNGYGVFAGTDWSVLVEQSQSSISSEFINARNSILLISAIGMIGSIIVGIFVSVSIAKPLLNLSLMAKRLSGGDFSVRAQKSSIYEIEMIDESFNNMAKSLKKLVETEVKLAEAHVQIKNERLSAIGELAASLAHNLKNPLGTIRSSADILRREYKDSNKEILDVIFRMNRAIERMAHQIDDVLNFIRTTPLNLEETSLVAILNLVVKSSSIPTNIKIELPENDFKIKCDIRKLEVVFSNLILNAVEAIGNKNDGTIIIRAKEDPGYVLIEIQDSGHGISDDLLPRLFEPLVTTKFQGTGLGLSSCKNIIEQHGGTISVKNNPTAFTIKLPRKI